MGISAASRIRSTVGRHISDYEILIEGEANYRAVCTIAYDVSNPSDFRNGGSEIEPALAEIDELYLILEGGGEFQLIGKENRIEPIGIWELVKSTFERGIEDARQDCARDFGEQA